MCLFSGGPEFTGCLPEEVLLFYYEIVLEEPRYSVI